MQAVCVAAICHHSPKQRSMYNAINPMALCLQRIMYMASLVNINAVPTKASLVSAPAGRREARHCV